MLRRPAKPSLPARAFGHSFGVLGVIMALNAVATTIDPRLIRFFPFRDTGLQQLSAALVAIGLIALALFLVAARGPVKVKLNPSEGIDTRDQ